MHERQAREAEQARLEREREAKAAAERRAAAWNKARPYVLAVIAVLVLAGAGAGYNAYRKERLRLRTERMAAEQQRKEAEQQRLAEEQRAEQQRLAEQREQEQQRLAAEREREQQRAAAEKRRIEAEKRAEEERIAEERRQAVRAGYNAGDVYDNNGIKGLVIIKAVNPRTPGVIISLDEFHLTWNEARTRCRNGWRLPSIAELNFIHSNKQFINTHAVAQGAAILGNYRYWSSESGGKQGDIWCIAMGSGAASTWEKESKNHVRLVHEF